MMKKVNLEMNRSSTMIKCMALPLALVGWVISSPVLAQEQPKFSTIDSLLRGMTDQLAKGVDEQKNVQKSPPLALAPREQEVPKSTPVLPQGSKVQSTSVDSSSSKLLAEDKPEQSGNLNIRFTEMPPNSRFTFSRDVFIPAYKLGVVLRDGIPVLNIEPGVELIDVFRDPALDSRHCAILSDKSYVMARGGKPDRESTWLSVSNIDIVSLKVDEGGVKNLARVTFAPKSGRDIDAAVAFSLVCVMDPSYNSSVHGYRLQDMNISLNGLFSIELPRFIEL